VSTEGELLVALAVAIGVLGVVVPVLPGELLIAGGIGVWAVFTGGLAAWSVAAVSLTVLAVGWAGGWWLGRRHLGAAGVPRRTLLIGGLVGAVGFFVVPVVGLPLGFVTGVYAAERTRGLPHQVAWPATTAALRATGLVLLVHLAGALSAAACSGLGAVLL
jgi:uncharacterized protein YqgC (DUF456 family)